MNKVTFIQFGNSLHVQRKCKELCRARSLLKSYTLNYSAEAVNYKNFRLCMINPKKTAFQLGRGTR